MNKMYTTNSLWDCFAESIFNARMIKSPALNSTQCTFPDNIPPLPPSFPGFAKGGRCRGDGCVSVSVQQLLLPQMGIRRHLTPGFVREIENGRGLCLSWKKSNVNNCVEYMTTLLSLKMSLCLPLERWNYRNRNHFRSVMKKYNKATLEVYCLVIRQKGFFQDTALVSWNYDLWVELNANAMFPW